MRDALGQWAKELAVSWSHWKASSQEDLKRFHLLTYWGWRQRITPSNERQPRLHDCKRQRQKQSHPLAHVLAAQQADQNTRSFTSLFLPLRRSDGVRTQKIRTERPIRHSLKIQNIKYTWALSCLKTTHQPVKQRLEDARLCKCSFCVYA